MKNKTLKRSLVAIMIFSMVAMYGYMPIASAASLTAVSDLITDSEIDATGVTHTVTFTNGVLLGAGDVITVDFNDVIGVASGNATCPSDATEGGAGSEITCTVVTPIAGLTVNVLTLTGTTNPATEGSYQVDIVTSSSGAEVEKSAVRIYILDDVIMTAHVDPTLQLVVTGVASSTALNGTALCNMTTTATTTDFGTLNPGVAKTICQTLGVTTNATAGFTVTVEQDNELENTTGDNINSFNNSPDGTGSTTAEAWGIPAGLLDADHTYGHMGVTSNDTDLATATGYEELYNAVNTPHYVGLDAANPQEVMHHDGPADGSTQDKGLIMVGYTAEIDALQQAGDYTNTLTYIATAIF